MLKCQQLLHFNIYEQDKFHEHEKSFINSGSEPTASVSQVKKSSYERL